MSKPINHVVIVGGGSAGWLTAGVLAADHPALQVTLIESPDVAPIGVGEGTWPSMRDTLSRIGVSESAFFRECDAAFKQGSRFNDWREGGGAADYYFHPFVLPQGYGETDLVRAWLDTGAAVPFADLVSYQPHLCVQGRAPKQPATPEFAAVANYGYHLDAGKFGLFLKKHCLEKLGVRYVPDHVTGIDSAPNGDIAALRTRAHGPLAGDLFVDCTGMQSMLLGGHYGVPLLRQKHVLFNDSALAVQVPYAAPDSPIASQTTSTAQRAGWIWDIGLPTRRGIGHVYSSAHTSDAEAEADLRRYVAATGGPADMPAPRKLTFEPGYRQRFWHHNVVAIGLSAGFIEPLEASALALVEMSAAMVSDDLPANRDAMDIVAHRFNDAFTYRWERVIEFLKLHYVLSRRTGSDYWHDNRRSETIPARLRELLTLWRHRAPSRLDFYRIEEVFPSASWQYVLYGMGFLPERDHVTRRTDTAAADPYFREAAELTRRMLRALPSNRELLDHIRLHGLQKI
ncbi:tryptophan halogenase [Pseudoduganella flava]|uniref:FAD-dependent oxidoreductase n=1 Tax=Pseudoduganella flava TaxID=871742 RepID=A0A562PH34_9BURK|nr:tryptophan halogenase family protein [Pseudoduganella flava]QGZ40367.1 FAD-dependent oxidoreductase [Pseudoduganella flava]TWI43560.1 tryptophan halogenase [Pseudoduganella flava]